MDFDDALLGERGDFATVPDDVAGFLQGGNMALVKVRDGYVVEGFHFIDAFPNLEQGLKLFIGHSERSFA